MLGIIVKSEAVNPTEHFEAIIDFLSCRGIPCSTPLDAYE